MVAIIAICFAVGLITLLCNCLNLLGLSIAGLLKYIVGPGLIIYCLLYIIIYGL